MRFVRIIADSPDPVSGNYTSCQISHLECTPNYSHVTGSSGGDYLLASPYNAVSYYQELLMSQTYGTILIPTEGEFSAPATAVIQAAPNKTSLIGFGTTYAVPILARIPALLPGQGTSMPQGNVEARIYSDGVWVICGNTTLFQVSTCQGALLYRSTYTPSINGMKMGFFAFVNSTSGSPNFQCALADEEQVINLYRPASYDNTKLANSLQMFEGGLGFLKVNESSVTHLVRQPSAYCPYFTDLKDEINLDDAVDSAVTAVGKKGYLVR